MRVAFIAVALSFACFVACSDDTKPTPDKGTTAGDKGTVVDQPTTTGDKGTTTGDKGTTTADKGTATGACTSTADKAAVDGTTKWGGKTIKEITSGQAACLTDPNPEACIVKAVKTAVNNEVSDGCITCYAQSAMCTVQNCLAAGCVTAPTDPACVKCQCGENTAKKNCIKAFSDCSGVPATTVCP